MFPLGGAGQTRRRHQPLTTLTFLPLAFKDFYYQMPPIQGLELPPYQIVLTGTGRVKRQSYKNIHLTACDSNKPRFITESG